LAGLELGTCTGVGARLGFCSDHRLAHWWGGGSVRWGTQCASPVWPTSR